MAKLSPGKLDRDIVNIKHILLGDEQHNPVLVKQYAQ